ncbi:MAG: hypothetical protein IPM54_27255 [Polyangiaceae bacterium]|nr:hypothetical protein [Polyangiaceae bacterium]
MVFENHRENARVAPGLWFMVALFVALSTSGCSSESLGGGGGNGGAGGEWTGSLETRDDGEREAFLLPPPSNAQTCTANNQCSTGYCVDGFCCDSKCDNKCMACSAAKKGSGSDGVCGSIKYDTDPDNDCPNGACDGKNMCKNYNGAACTSAAQCLSNYCVDGYCCNNICMGACQACSAAKKGSGNNGACGAIAVNTDPDNECAGGECNGTSGCTTPQTPAANGTPCTSAAQCASGYCADGVCCDSWCLGSCQACSAAKKGSGVNGVCGPIANDTDPDEECWGGSCDGKSTCKQYNGVPCTSASQCLSGYCVDGFCCGNICNSMCYACSEAKKGQGYDGVCGPIASGKDLEDECNPGECNGAGSCNQPQTPQANGTACVSGGQCASSYCIDGVCCENACTGTCMACTEAKKGSGADGICASIGYDRDPDEECYGGGCSGSGACKYYNGLPCVNGSECLSNYCVDGYCCNNVCTGACAACSAAKKGSGFNGVCGLIAANTDPDNECTNGECTGAGACNSPQQPAADGTPCASAAQCASGFCTDGVCCSGACNDPCLACTAAKKGQGSDGACGPIIAGTDPDSECPTSDCNGAGACITPMNLPNGTSCAASSECASGHCVDGLCCDDACTGSCLACTAAKKGQGSDGTCGPIKYDTDPEEECYGGACNGSGGCQSYNGVPCTMGTQCLSGWCVDGVCCGNHCGGLCYACTAAKKGSGYDGVCGLIANTMDPDAECPDSYCNGAGACKINTCTTHGDCAQDALCLGGQCVCNEGYSGGGLTCTDINECLTNNGGCDTNAMCMNMPGTRTCECNPGFTGDGFTCADVDECLVNNGGCDVNATCTNISGSRTCACNTNYQGDGFTCIYNGPIVEIEAGYDSACARDADNRVKCWGANGTGGLGLGDKLIRGDGPGEMGNNPAHHTCALLNDATVKCWGNATEGRLGLGDMQKRGDNPGEMGDNLPAVDLGTGKTALSITTGYGNTCALLTDGSLKCWGMNDFGVLGLGNNVDRGDHPGEMGDNLPAVNLGTGKTAVAVSIYYHAACAILNDGSLKCWGYGGTIGAGDSITRGDGPGEMGDNLPTVDLGTGKTAIAVRVGMEHRCAILNDGSVKCWGHSTYGELGQGDMLSRGNAPGQMGDMLPIVNLGTGKTALALTAGHSFTCAVLDDNSVKCWGRGTYGQLGLGDKNNRGDGPNEMGDLLPAVNIF